MVQTRASGGAGPFSARAGALEAVMATAAVRRERKLIDGKDPTILLQPRLLS
jgi:hypothetical protein